MKAVLIVLTLAAIVLLAYWGIRVALGVQVSKRLIQEAIPYEKQSTDTSVSFLVLGDSTAVGVGANTPEDSLAGRVAKYIGATEVENYAVSGATVRDLPGQIKKAQLAVYSVILVQIGANDIVRFHPAGSTSALLAEELKALPKAGTVIVISAGDVGDATLIPPLLRPFYTRLNRAYHAAFQAALFPEGIRYVNLGAAPGSDLFSNYPKTYLAADGFHPSSAGYGVWFNAIQPALPVPSGKK